ncbi:MAG: SUMF1/EgtB/PvdO family nonheme iron enzyme [Verrucomicrobiae bacterium]|nr:SUMF1/EgtB/PvdO family nonheme iron enzyme [Verrucomicrobiae bacterium]
MMGRTSFGALAIACAALAGDVRADVFGTGGNQFTIDFVYVGNVSNGNDGTAYGGVGYEYQIAVREVSQDMIDKATASGLTNVTAGAHTGAEPAASISWYEAAAFVNWLNESKGYQKAYDLAWTGSTWTQHLWSASEAWVVDGTNLFRHRDTYYVLPSEDEWYKAAYHKNDGITANYWDYATARDSAPTGTVGGTLPFTAVYDDAYGSPVPSDPADVDMAGGLSAYGTMGQNGNVWEWNESALDGANNSSVESRGFRGGDWASASGNLLATFRTGSAPGTEITQIGFRVAMVPEPSGWVWVLVAAGGLLAARRGRRRF